MIRSTNLDYQTWSSGNRPRLTSQALGTVNYEPLTRRFLGDVQTREPGDRGTSQAFTTYLEVWDKAWRELEGESPGLSSGDLVKRGLSPPKSKGVLAGGFLGFSPETAGAAETANNHDRRIISSLSASGAPAGVPEEVSRTSHHLDSPYTVTEKSTGTLGELEGFTSTKERETEKGIRPRRFKCADTTCAFYAIGFYPEMSLQKHNHRYHTHYNEAANAKDKTKAPMTSHSIPQEVLLSAEEQALVEYLVGEVWESLVPQSRLPGHSASPSAPAGGLELPPSGSRKTSRNPSDRKQKSKQQAQANDSPEDGPSSDGSSDDEPPKGPKRPPPTANFGRRLPLLACPVWKNDPEHSGNSMNCLQGWTQSNRLKVWFGVSHFLES